MIDIAVMYPADSGTKFDHDYYMQTHMPLVRERWMALGLQDTKVMRGTKGPDGAAPAYTVMTVLTFDSMESFKAAGDRHGKEIFGDIPNFTDGKPVMQFFEAA